MNKKYRTLEELNAAAEKLREEQDIEGLLALAEEYGIDEEDARDYMDTPELEVFAAPLEAAAGRLNAEAGELKLKGILADWKDLIAGECAEDEDLCRRILTKDLTGCMAALLKFSFENKEQVPDNIVKATTIRVNGKEQTMRSPLYMGAPDQAQARKIIRGYYGAAKDGEDA